jgi:hypothetical protein
VVSGCGHRRAGLHSLPGRKPRRCRLRSGRAERNGSTRFAGLRRFDTASRRSCHRPQPPVRRRGVLATVREPSSHRLPGRTPTLCWWVDAPC